MMTRPQSSAGERWLICAFFCFIILVVSGCSTLQYREALSAEDDRLLLGEVPFFPQGDYQCGPAALAMLLAWNGEEIDLSQLVEQVYSPALKGSLQPAIIASARRQGYLAYPIHGWASLVAELKSGQPVMILQNLGLSWFPRWHYAVVIGFDQGSRKVILHSGTTAEMKMSMPVFERTWRRGDYWGLVVVPPAIVPATADESAFLAAAVGLERAEQFEAANRAYLTAVDVWPDSFVAWMGVGNSSYRDGDKGAAIIAFRQAAMLQPDNGIPLNNLALVLAETGRRAEALAVIDEAIDLGGALKGTYQQTRWNILGHEPQSD